MTLRKNMTKGERFSVVEKKVSQLEMAGRVSQMLIQQIGNSVSPMAKDVGELSARLREIQYSVLAMRELLGLDVNAVNAKSEELQIRDFNEASAKEDVEKGYTDADVVSEDSVVILTSTTDSEKGGYLRSKVSLKEIGLPDMREKLLGKKVGDQIETDISGAKHVVTILGIKAVPAQEEKLQVNG